MVTYGMQAQDLRAEFQREYAERRRRFHALLGALRGTDWRAPSRNPGWKNGEIATHIVFGFVLQLLLVPIVRLWSRLPRDSSKWFAWLLNAAIVPFNWLNAVGARAQSALASPESLGRIMDRIMPRLSNMIGSLRPDDLGGGMYFPHCWDPVSFREYMTLAEVLRYPLTHFDFHVGQIVQRSAP